MMDFKQKAIDSLADFPENKTKSALLETLNFVLDRQS